MQRSQQHRGQPLEGLQVFSIVQNWKLLLIAVVLHIDHG